MPDFKEIFLKGVWYQFCLGLSYNLRLREYATLIRRKNKIIDSVVIIMALVASLLAGFKIYFATIITAFLAALLSFIKDFLPILKKSEAELVEIDSLNTYFTNYLYKMKNIYDNVKFGNKSPDSFEKEFSYLVDEGAPYITKTNKLYKTLPPKTEKTIDNKIHEYVKRNYPESPQS